MKRMIISYERDDRDGINNDTRRVNVQAGMDASSLEFTRSLVI